MSSGAASIASEAGGDFSGAGEVSPAAASVFSGTAASPSPPVNENTIGRILYSPETKTSSSYRARWIVFPAAATGASAW
ncbi:MAG TPA: hypothetical protein DCM87_13915 [Planctomycetes bacterium]|nr:hypothetical protein [Planctomycetota bacterium]